jgi:peptide/nickel transport system substrate-binding protein
MAVIALALALVLTGCAGGGAGGGASAGSSPTPGGNLVIARAGDALSMNPTTTFDNNSIYVMEQMMEPLFMVSPDGKSVQPWLASSYTMSPDKLTYTIKLRSGVKFSNGQPLTAADVKFSLDQNTKTGNQGWGYINSAINTVTAVNPSTVQIKLKYAWAPLLADLSLFSNSIVPNNYGGKTEAAFYNAPIGTGPFIWNTWKKGQYIKVLKNSTYWQPGKPYLNSVTWQNVPDANTRALQLQGGQIDINAAPDWSSFATLKNTPNINTYAFPSTELDYIALNEKRTPFNDVHIRRAISYALDRQAMVKAVLYGNGTAANSLLSPGTPYYDKNAGGLTYNVAKAKAELAQSSKPNGFTTSLLIASGDPNQAAVAQIMQSELKAIGITLNITQMDPTANHQARLAGNFDMAYSLWTMDIPDPDEWTSWATNPSGGARSAFTSYNNPKVIALNQQAQRETDPTKRASLYAQLQQLTGQDAFLAYLYYAPYAYATTSSVHGFQVTPLGNSHLENVYKTN